jgi:glycerophosphoryl diester phosphodiesterase
MGSARVLGDVLPAAHLYPKTPIILGHRGASVSAPENTLAAFGRALEQGADGFELDVTLSADGVPVVIHDDTLDRTTTGSGRVSGLSLKALMQLGAGYPARFGQAFAGERLPTLAEVFAVFGSRAIINVELEADRSAERPLAARVVDEVRAHGLERRVILSSFQFSNLKRVRALDPSLPIGLLYGAAAGGARLARCLAPSLWPDAHHPGYSSLTAAGLDWYHRQNLRVNTWTVNSEPELRALIEAGVDGLITDRPDLAVAVRRALARE